MAEVCEEMRNFSTSLGVQASQTHLAGFLRRFIELTSPFGSAGQRKTFRETFKKMREELDGKDWSAVPAPFLNQYRYRIDMAELLLDAYSLTTFGAINNDKARASNLLGRVQKVIGTCTKIAASGVYVEEVETKAPVISLLLPSLF